MYRLVLILALTATLSAPVIVVAQDDTDVGEGAPLCVRIVTADDGTESPQPAGSAAPDPSSGTAPQEEPSPGPEASTDPADATGDDALAAALADGSATLEVVPAEECASGAGDTIAAGDDDTAIDDTVGPDETDAAATTEDPEPTPKPRGSTRSGQKRTPYARFVARGVSAVVSLVTLVRQNDGADTQAEVAGAARQLERWANGQRRWLRKHPPQRCYRGAHRRWLAGISKVADGARDLRIGVLELDARQAGRGVRRITTGTSRISAIDFDATSERCVEAAARR